MKLRATDPYLVQEEDVFVTVSDTWDFLPHGALETVLFRSQKACESSIATVVY